MPLKRPAREGGFSLLGDRQTQVAGGDGPEIQWSSASTTRGWYDGCQGCWTRRASNRSYGYVETRDARHTPTIVDRGADALVAAGRIGEATTAALKAGARQRIAEGRLLGHVAYASLVARLPN